VGSIYTTLPNPNPTGVALAFPVRIMKVFFRRRMFTARSTTRDSIWEITTYYEAPKRLLQIRQALEENGIFQIENADRSIDAKKHALQVHSEDYIEYLETAFRLWVEGGGDPKVQADALKACSDGYSSSLASGSTLPRDLP
jgi:acetoin utilization deacetylase AcuC-like enzyme